MLESVIVVMGVGIGLAGVTILLCAIWHPQRLGQNEGLMLIAISWMLMMLLEII